jgi:transcriptional regulator with XRE-family HTH domain
MRYKKNDIGPQLRKLRKERAWTVGDFATELARNGVFLSEQTLSKVESRTVAVTPIQIAAFAQAFHVQVENLAPEVR